MDVKPCSRALRATTRERRVKATAVDRREVGDRFKQNGMVLRGRLLARFHYSRLQIEPKSTWLAVVTMPKRPLDLLGRRHRRVSRANLSAVG